MIVTQPSHLQAERGGDLTAEERDMYRAELVRENFAHLPTGNAGAS